MTNRYPCGNCPDVGYEEALSEWTCERHHVLLGYSLQPYKCRYCSIIGTNGDTRRTKDLFDWLGG